MLNPCEPSPGVNRHQHPSMVAAMLNVFEEVPTVRNPSVSVTSPVNRLIAIGFADLASSIFWKMSYKISVVETAVVPITLTSTKFCIGDVMVNVNDRGFGIRRAWRRIVPYVVRRHSQRQLPDHIAIWIIFGAFRLFGNGQVVESETALYHRTSS